MKEISEETGKDLSKSLNYSMEIQYDSMYVKNIKSSLNKSMAYHVLNDIIREVQSYTKFDSKHPFNVIKYILFRQKSIIHIESLLKYYSNKLDTILRV